MKKIKKLLPIILGVLAISTAQAYQDDCCEPEPECQCSAPPPCCEIPTCPTTAAFNQSAAIDVCGSWDTYANATFLWWQPMQEQMEFAINPIAGQGTAVNTISKFSFDWKAGFKVGIGFHYDRDNWDNYLRYTRLNSSMANKASLTGITNQTLNDLWSILQNPVNTVREIKIKWDLDFNIFDLELARAYYNGQHLTFRAHYGLKGGWIDQNAKITKTDTITGNSVEATVKSDSWLIGPKAGIESNWNLGEGFRLFGNASASLFYQKFSKIQFREPYVSNPTQWYQARDLEAYKVNGNLEGIVGLGYSTYFSRNNWHFDIFAGYEMQLYLNQNMMRYLEQVLKYTPEGYQYLVITKPGNLMFHGLNLTMKFEF